MNPNGSPATLDTRVARSPLVALRFHLDALAADVDGDIDRVERRLIDTTAERANLMRRLRRSESARRAELDATRPSRERVLATAQEELIIAEALTRAEERLPRLKERLEDLITRRTALRTASLALRDAASEQASFDGNASLLTHAARSMFQLLGDEYQALADGILGGPMQLLADACFEAELIEQTTHASPARATDHAARCRAAVGEAAASLDTLMLQFSPVSAQRSLVDALRLLLRGEVSAGHAGLRVVGAERRLAHLQEVALYRIVEEAVKNATRHGRSAHVEVVLAFHVRRVSLLVKDDGDGFDVVATEARLGRTRGLGLIRMREHASLVGSRLEVRSLLGVGTEVRATVASPAASG